MSVVVIETDDLERWIRETVAASVQTATTQDLPPFLRREEFMNLLGIGEAKTAELFNRPDFPVIRDFGHPRVVTHLLMQWAEKQVGWINEKASENFKNRRRNATV
ncbi:DNA-binding protein [Paenibacillus sp. FSL R10-2791]|uniref:DNA-binding protein n=1 Tax=Paenibacillus sp. FSL R10-2791 TaxID=2954695 RepID=UPI0030FABCB9